VKQVNEMLKTFFGTFVGVIVAVSVSLAEEQLEVGMVAPTSVVAEFITGDLAKFRSVCPVLANRDAVKVAVFVKSVDDPVLPLVEAIEEVVADDAALKWSFVFVSHENAPTPSTEEWDAQFAHLKKLASDRKINHLSIGMMLRNPDNGKPSKAKRQLGFFGDGDVVVMLIRPDAKGKRGLIQYLSVLKSEEIEKETIEHIRSQLKDALAAASVKG
jgi:hypothetical protein